MAATLPAAAIPSATGPGGPRPAMERHASRRIDPRTSTAGIDVAPVTAWLDANVAGAVGPFTFDADRRRPLQPDLPRHRRRRAPLRAAPPAARPRAGQRPRHGPRAPHHRRPAGRTAVPVAPALGLLRRRRGQRRAVLRDGLRRRPRRPRPRRRPSACSTPDGPAQRQPSRSSTRWPPSTPSTSTPSGSADLGRTRATSPASSSGGTASGTQSEDPRAAARRRGPRRARRHGSPSRARPTIVHGDYRLDNCMVDDDGDVVAVLDWEICTLGDPLADVGLLHGLLDRPGDEPIARGPASATTAPGFSDRAELARPLRRGVGRDLVAARLLRRVRATGSWPASSRASTPATSAARSGERDPAELEPFKPQVDGAARRRPRETLERAADDRRRPTLVDGDAADARRAGAGRDADGLDRRQRRGRGGDGRARARSSTRRPLATLRRRHVHRLPRPAADDASCATASTRGSCGRRSSCRPAATPTATTCCCSPATSPTSAWHRFADAVVDLAVELGVAHDGRPRRLPVRRAAHPAAAPVDDVAVGRRRSPALPFLQELGRRAGRHGGGARARAARRAACPPSASGRRCRTTSRRCRTRRRRVALLDGPARRSPGSTVDGADAAPARPSSSASASTSSSPATTSTGRWSRQLEAALRRRAERARRRRRRAGRPRAAVGRRAGRRARALPPRPGQELTADGRARDYGRRHEGRRRHRHRSRQGAARRPRSSRRPATTGVWTAETSHDPFFPLLLGGRAHRDARARHVDRRRLRPQPDDAGQHRLGPAGVLEGPLHPRPRQPDQAAHHQALLDAVDATRRRACAR